MSGNTTTTGLKTGQSLFSAALLSGTAIAFFVGGSFAGTWTVSAKNAQSHRLIFGAAALLLAIFAALSLYGAPNHTYPNAVLGVALLSFAMGLVNPALSKIGAEAISLTFVTGTLNKVGTHLALAARHVIPTDAQGPWDTHGYRARVEAGLWAGFLSGAILSGILAPRFGPWSLFLPLAVLALFAALSQAETSSQTKTSHADAPKAATLGRGPG